MSWHIHDSERPMFDQIGEWTAPWDGHDTPEKYRRVEASAFAVVPQCACGAPSPNGNVCARCDDSAALRAGLVEALEWLRITGRSPDDSPPEECERFFECVTRLTALAEGRSE